MRDLCFRQKWEITKVLTLAADIVQILKGKAPVYGNGDLEVAIWFLKYLNEK